MKITNEAKIGLLVVCVLVALGALTWQVGDYNFTPEGYRLKARFKNIDGVTLNAPVTLNGFEVGRIEDIRLIYGENENVELTLWIDDGAKVRDGAQAVVKNLGFMGEKYIALTSGPAEKEFLAPDALVIGREPGSFEKILSDGELIAANIKEISVNVNERLRLNSEAIDTIIADLRISMKNVSSITDNVNERLSTNKDLIDDLMVQLNSTSHHLEEMSYDLKMNPWKLLYKETKDNDRSKKQK